ncbi:phosphotransferase family protein [Bradyrhizobium sp. CCBAU 51753]|uniref:phosphotransferase family protein n=1 Tax=Bradyrhizobium sp. CCBAU 51753 TaxID=1325100 RepID=UPI00188B7D03|nr:phosphotransferase family protein [Bradyrhizobium sp. CCBAU 51753]QOZ23899.1 phosphotransferase family protein [Bradyrhizobium sp. CCBAU 51753]
MDATIDVAGLVRWLSAKAPGNWTILTLTKYAGGQSNPTYRLDTPDGPCVLRRTPFGELLPSAHAIDREYRVISALNALDFPVPRAIALCEDRSVIGAKFYVMEFVAGSIYWNGALPEMSPQQRGNLYRNMIRTLARLHQVDFGKAGLSDFGKPGNYFARQIGRWTKQYRASQTDDLDVIEKLIEWLPRTLPRQTRTSIIHGDYRLDNLVFDTDPGRVLAVIDWELATLGDPLADLSMLLMNWIVPADGGAGLGGIDLSGTGIPTLDEARDIYSEASGRDDIPDLHWYFAYNLFRTCGILQGVKRRMLDGNASSDKAEEAVAKIPLFAKLAWAEAQKLGAT